MQAPKQAFGCLRWPIVTDNNGWFGVSLGVVFTAVWDGRMVLTNCSAFDTSRHLNTIMPLFNANTLEASPENWPVPARLQLLSNAMAIATPPRSSTTEPLDAATPTTGTSDLSTSTSTMGKDNDTDTDSDMDSDDDNGSLVTQPPAGTPLPARSNTISANFSPIKRSWTMDVKRDLVIAAFYSGNPNGVEEVATQNLLSDRRQLYTWHNVVLACGLLDDHFGRGNSVEAARQRNFFSRRRAIGGGRRSISQEDTYESLVMFYEHHVQFGYRITVTKLARYLTLLEYGIGNPGAPSLAAMSQRVHRWKNRHSIVIRRATHVAQNIVYDEKVIADFVMNVNDTIKALDIRPDCVVNMDETNVYFNMTGSDTLADRGARTVSLCSTQSTNRCTLSLACTMDGQMLPSFIIFKGVRTDNGRVMKEVHDPLANGYPAASTQKYTVQNKAWVNEEVMLEWIDVIWKPFCASKGPGTTTYLLLDVFRAHMTSKVMEEFAKLGTVVKFIVAGYTSKLQVLDVGVNKLVKIHLAEFYDDHMLATEGGRVSRVDIAHWVHGSVEKVSPDTIVKTFQSIGYIKD
jgi:DDE superfamily endonuclease